jgi:hypothetical protein
MPPNVFSMTAAIAAGTPPANSAFGKAAGHQPPDGERDST